MVPDIPAIKSNDILVAWALLGVHRIGDRIMLRKPCPILYPNDKMARELSRYNLFQPRKWYDYVRRTMYIANEEIFDNQRTRFSCLHKLKDFHNIIGFLEEVTELHFAKPGSYGRNRSLILPLQIGTNRFNTI